MRGLGFALGLPVWGESAFAVTAEAVGPQAGRLLVALDSGRGALFVQVFDASGAQDGPPEDSPYAAVAARWGDRADIAVTGDEAARAFLNANGFACLRPGMAPASALAQRVARLRAAGVAPTVAVPLYIRPPDATPPAQGGRLRA